MLVLNAEILKEQDRSLSRRTSVVHFCTSFLETRASPTVQFDSGDENRNDSPPVQENVPLP